MKLELDNNQRIFFVKREGYFTRQYFCNLHHIPEIITAELEKFDSYTVSEFWNGKFKRVTKNRLNELFTSNQINFKIK